MAPPSFTAEETFRQCINRVRDQELRRRLEQITDDVIEAADAFELASRSTTLHTMRPCQSVGGVVTKDEMSAVYTYRMAKRDAPARFIYDQIKGSARHGTCPLCGQRNVTTLDHHLPKAHYPALAVSPLNLVPACSDCNKAKIDNIPTDCTDQTLHPYFDNVEEAPWLAATVIEGDGATLLFRVEPPAEWDAVLATRVQKHFEILGLGSLYATHAAEEMRNIQGYLRALLNSAGSDAVREHLNDMAASREAIHKNSWQTATYKALASSAWYCETGLLLEP